MFQVYKIESFDAKSNSHSIGIRSENWFVRKDKQFEAEEQAKEYVRTQNRIHSILPTYLITMKTQKEKDEFVDYFCFDPDSKYIHERKYFLEWSLSIQKKVLDRLKKDGIKIV